MTNRDGGKGDAPRPLGINKDQFDKNWDEVFKKEKDGSLTVNIDVENQDITTTVEVKYEF